MPAEPGTVGVDQVGRATWLVDLHGEHDVLTSESLRAELSKIFAQGTTVVIDLMPATFIDSSIINELVHAQRRVESVPNERLAVVAPQGGFPARVLEAVKLGHVISIFETRQDALRAVDGL